MTQAFTFRLNGRRVRVNADGDRRLLWILRSDLGLTGPKFGCGEAQCGACTVLVEDEAVRSCAVALKEVAGKRVVTIEGLSRNGKLHALQQAFQDRHAFQCGFCTSGMILGAYALLRRVKAPSREEILEAMDGHLCRCGAHPRIVEAIQAAAKAGGPR